MSQIIDMFGNITISKKKNVPNESDIIAQFEEFCIEEEFEQASYEEEFEQASYEEEFDKMSVDEPIPESEDSDDSDLEGLNEDEKEYRLVVKNWDGVTENDYVEHDYDSEEQHFDYWTSDNDFED